MAACGHYSGIQCVVAVAVRAHLDEPPAGAQEGSELAADYDAALHFAVLCQFEEALNVVFEETANISRVVEVALSELLGFLITEVLAQ